MNHGREDQNPWDKWYWQDWLADAGLRACSLAARGLWMDMLSVMARSKRKGYLLDGEKQMESKSLAKISGESEATVAALMAELFSHGVPSKSDDGIIFNRRMVRDAAISAVRADAGRRGGRPKKQNESKTKANIKQDVKANSKAPSASASIYASIIEFLNLKTGKNFSAKSKATIAHIKARIGEGRTLDEFKHVIAVKVHQWLNDPKMNAYLRPETLFGSKMEAYLNESIMLTPEEREKRVGAGPEKTPEQKSAERERESKIKAFHREMENKWEPLIEKAGTPEERKRLTREANIETESGIQRIAGYQPGA